MEWGFLGVAIKRVAIIGELEGSDGAVAREVRELQAELNNDDELLEVIDAC